MIPADQVFTHVDDLSWSYRHWNANTPVPDTGTGEGTSMLPVLVNKGGVTIYVPSMASILQNDVYG